MTIYANHYVRVAGKLYAPGDMIQYNMPEVDRALLAKKGAIRIEDIDVLPEDENGPEIVFAPMEEKADTEDVKIDEADDLDDIVVAPVKKKTSRKKG